jgi:hypothetical protein
MPTCAELRLICVSGTCTQVVTPVQRSGVELSACPLVVESGAEYVARLKGPFYLTAEEGFLVSAGLISCWAAAYGVRSIIKIIKGSSE